MIAFSDIEVEKYKFYQHKSPILIGDLNINEIIVSNKVFFIKKGFNILLVTNMMELLDRYV